MKLRVKPGPRQGLGRVDLPYNVNDGEEYYIRELKLIKKVTGAGRFSNPCLIFPLQNLKVGDEVEVVKVLKCRMCGRRTTALINECCDRCFQWETLGDMVAPPYAAVLCGRGG